jgi:hypothetical protein
MFLISGFIPRVTPYEKGVIRGIRFNGATGSWETDELIEDERLVMCNLKGIIFFFFLVKKLLLSQIYILFPFLALLSG